MRSALYLSSQFAERSEENRGSGNSLGLYGGNSRISTRHQATTPTILKRALGLVMALKKILPLYYTANDPGVDMTLDSVVCFLI